MFDYLNEFMFVWSRGKNNTYKQAMKLKKQGEAHLFNMLCQEWCSRFRWTTNEKTINTNLIERTILFDAYCGIAKLTQSSENYSEETWRNWRVSGTDNQSFYGLPNRATLTSYNGKITGGYIPVQDDDLSDIANSVLIRDSFQKPFDLPINTILYYAERLSVVNTSINACIKNILGTSAIVCSQEQREQIIKQRESASLGIPYLLVYDDIYGVNGIGQTQLLSTAGASEELTVMFNAFDKIHADYLQSIGIRANNSADRKSGITPLEITENRKNCDLILRDGLEARKKACEQLKRIGLNDLDVDLDYFEGLVNDYIDTGETMNNVEPEYAKDKGGEKNDTELS